MPPLLAIPAVAAITSAISSAAASLGAALGIGGATAAGATAAASAGLLAGTTTAAGVGAGTLMSSILAGSAAAGTIGPTVASAAAATAAAAGATTAAASGLSAANILSGLGTGASMLAQSRAGESQAKIAEYNAEVARNAADAAGKAGAYEEEIFRQKSKRILEMQNLGYAAAGVDVASGSPLQIMASTAANIERDAQAINYKGQVEGARLRSEANINDSMADIYRQRGMLGAGATLLGGLLNDPYSRRSLGNMDMFGSPLKI